MGIIALIVSIFIVFMIYLLAKNQQRNRGPVKSGAEWWADERRRQHELAKLYGHQSSYYRRRD